MSTQYSKLTFHDLAPERAVFFQDVCRGLSRKPKSLPCKYLYDEAGSRLFNAICETPEYYPTRTELGIMRQFAPEMAEMIGPQSLLIEYGCGNGEKIRLLLDHLADPAGYVPIDISKDHMKEAVAELHRRYPGLPIAAVCVDFSRPFPLPRLEQKRIRKKLVYFPGSTIGNFHPPEVRELLKNMTLFLEKEDGLLIGVDLKKRLDVLWRAYNDESGYTEAFNRNILVRINQELEGTFCPEWFEHRAFYNKEKGRMEMHLESHYAHDVTVLGTVFSFYPGETIHTECSYKHTVEEFEALAGAGGFRLKTCWTDPQKYFAVLYLNLE